MSKTYQFINNDSELLALIYNKLSDLEKNIKLLKKQKTAVENECVHKWSEWESDGYSRGFNILIRRCLECGDVREKRL